MSGTKVLSTPGRSPVESVERARAGVYELLAGAFDFPGDAPYPWREGWEQRLTASLSHLPYRVRAADLRWSLPQADGLEAEYIRLFHVGGRSGLPCSLHGGMYGRDRSRTLQHLLRFYNFFGFAPGACVMPDHICVELEFMQRLSEGGRADPGSLIRAQRDFAQGQLSWLDELARRVREAKGAAFYRSLTLFASRFVRADTQYLAREALKGGGNGQD